MNDGQSFDKIRAQIDADPERRKRVENLKDELREAISKRMPECYAKDGRWYVEGGEWKFEPYRDSEIIWQSESRYLYRGTAENCEAALENLATAARDLGFEWNGDWTIPDPRRDTIRGVNDRKIETIYHDTAGAIPKRLPAAAELMCGEHHPVTAMVCTRERGHDGDHQSKHGNPWPAEATPNQILSKGGDSE